MKYEYGSRLRVTEVRHRESAREHDNMAEWENSWPEAEAALREAARVHAAALSREKDVMRQATRRAHAAEKALRALPAALERAVAAENALRSFQEKKGMAMRSAPPQESDEGIVSEQAAAAAVAEGVEAATVASEAEADAYCSLLCAELETLEVLGAEREADHARVVGELTEQRRLAEAEHDLRRRTLEEDLALMRASAAAAQTAAQEREEGLREQLAQAHAAGAQMEVLLEAERQAREAARLEAAEREAEVVLAWRNEVTELREALEAMRARVNTSHRLLCEQVGRELDTLEVIATQLRPQDTVVAPPEGLFDTVPTIST